MTKPVDLLPELRAWNDGRGISPLDYVFCYARSETATAYLDLFWPEFVVFEDYVFRAGFKEDGVRAWQARESIMRCNKEAATNYLDIAFLFYNSPEPRSELLEARILLIRATLVEIWAAKLKRNFTERTLPSRLSRHRLGRRVDLLSGLIVSRVRAPQIRTLEAKRQE